MLLQKVAILFSAIHKQIECNILIIKGFNLASSSWQ